MSKLQKMDGLRRPFCYSGLPDSNLHQFLSVGGSLRLTPRSREAPAHLRLAPWSLRGQLWVIGRNSGFVGPARNDRVYDGGICKTSIPLSGSTTPSYPT